MIAIEDYFDQESTCDEPVGSSIELFTGGGGLALAMHQVGFRHLLAVERDAWSCSTLLTNAARPFRPDGCGPIVGAARWPLLQGDVRGVDFARWLGRVDVVAGGVPCQPWSLGGAHKGFRDPRNLWPELFRCVRETRPKIVVAENVRGLLRSSFKPYYDYILRELAAPFESRGDAEDWVSHDGRLRRALELPPRDPTERYNVGVHLVNAADYGVPQIRWRVFVVAFRRDADNGEWSFPHPTHSESALLRAKESGEYWDRHAISAPGATAPCLIAVEEDIAPWRTLRDAICDLPTPVDCTETPGWLHHVGWPGARQYRGHTPNALDWPSKTVKAGVHGVPGGEGVVRLDDGTLRNLTVRETARLMTFPDRWELVGRRSEQMRQLGNAVPVALGRAVAGSLARSLRPAVDAAADRMPSSLNPSTDSPIFLR
jgi:DNA (cytosine-5)-methyltransferase 1